MERGGPGIPRNVRWLLAGALIGVATPAAPPTEAVALPPVPDLPAETPWVTPRAVHIVMPSVPDHRWGPETTGHVLLLTEAALGDLPGVLPQVGAEPPRPGFLGSLPADGAPWTLSLVLEHGDETLSLSLALCDPDGPCTEAAGVGSRVGPEPLVGELVAAIAPALGAPPEAADTLAARAPETTDPYAALMLGRAAAVLYGLHPAAEGDAIGDPRRDPVARAVFVDARMPSAWEVVSRWARDPAQRARAAQLAWEREPERTVRRADLGQARLALGSPAEAWAPWADGSEGLARDLRVALPRARAALAAGEAEVAGAVLDALGPRFPGHAEVVELRVAVAEARQRVDDDLLAAWQVADPEDPEPVRRRIARRLVDDDHVGALGLVTELARRGAGEEAGRLELALANDLEQYDRAAEAARTLGFADAASRLEAVGRRDPDARIAGLSGATSPEAHLVRAWALVDAGRPVEAREVAERLLRVRPHWPEALHLSAVARGRAGDVEGAAVARAQLLHADPLYFDVPR